MASDVGLKVAHVDCMCICMVLGLQGLEWQTSEQEHKQSLS